MSNARNTKRGAKTGASRPAKSKETRRLEKRIARIEGRTVSTAAGAKADRALAKELRKRDTIINPTSNKRPVAPSHFLTEEEALHHEFKRGGDRSFDLLELNVEPSIQKQHFVQHFSDLVVVANNSTVQYNVMGALKSAMGSTLTPKAFGSAALLNVDAPAFLGMPGPGDYGGAAASPVTRMTGGGAGSYIFDTAAAAGGFATRVSAIETCPFGTNNDTVGSYFRWQLTRIGVKVVNVTKGSDRGGEAILFQASHSVDAFTGLPTTGPVASIQNLGIFKSFPDFEVSQKKSDGSSDYIYFDTRLEHSAKHTYLGGYFIQTVGGSDLIVMLSNDCGSAQSVHVYFQLVWEIAGDSVRAIGLPHIIPKGVSNSVEEVKMVMTNANVIPSEVGAKHSVAAALSLNANPALQNQLSMVPVPRVPGPASLAHSTIGALVKVAGPHLQKLAAAGVKGLIAHAAAAVAGAV